MLCQSLELFIFDTEQVHVNKAGMVGLAPKWVRLDPKLEKSGTFSDQISVHLAHRAKCTEI